MLKIGTTFSGIGAPEQALKNLNIPHVVEWACDVDKHAKQTYLANHSAKTWFDDIQTIDVEKLGGVDIFAFGAPCQSYSQAGKRLGLEDHRGKLIYNCFSIIDNKKPKYFIFENVKGLLNHDEGNTFAIIKQSFEDLGYNIAYKVLNSRNFGVPQNRERLYVVGIRKDIKQTFNFELLQNSVAPLSSILDENVAEEFFHICPSMLRAIDKGKCKILDKNKYAYTLTTKQDRAPNSGFVEDGGRLRFLTPNECRKLQGFPENLIMPKSKYTAYKQFGNSMTVKVLEEIFKQLLVDEIPII